MTSENPLLRSGLMLSGGVFTAASTVVASLWPVDDNATRGWMTSLYRYRFKDGYTSSRAMRAAGLESLRTRRTAGLSTLPYYWASFVAVE